MSTRQLGAVAVGVISKGKANIDNKAALGMFGDVNGSECWNGYLVLKENGDTQCQNWYKMA